MSKNSTHPPDPTSQARRIPKKKTLKNNPNNPHLKKSSNNPPFKENFNNILLKNNPNNSPSNKKLLHKLLKWAILTLRVHTSPRSFPLLSLSPPELFRHSQTATRTKSEFRLSRIPYMDSKSRCRTKSVSPLENKDFIQTAVTMCSIVLKSISDFQSRKILKPPLELEKVNKKWFQIRIFSGVHPWWPPSFAQLAAEPRACGSSWKRQAKLTLAWGWRNWIILP